MKEPSLKEINKLIEQLCYRFNRYEVLTDVFEVSALALSNQFDKRREVWQRREEQYLKTINKYNAEEQKTMAHVFALIFNLLSNVANSTSRDSFADYLGELYMLSETSNAKTGQFFTPYHLSQACAAVSCDKDKLFNDLEKNGVILVNEPTCGSGGMVLAIADVLWNKHQINYTQDMLAICSDIDARCVHMAYLQLGLTGVPAVIYNQNTLTLETWDEWHTPALCMQWLKLRRYIKAYEKKE